MSFLEKANELLSDSSLAFQRMLVSFYKNGHEQSPEWSLRIEEKVRIEKEETEMKEIFRLMVFRKCLESIVNWYLSIASTQTNPHPNH